MSSIFVILLSIFYVMSTEVPPSHEMGSSDLMDDDDSTGDEHGSRPCPRCGAPGRGERGVARPVGGVGVVDVEPGAGKEGGSSAEVTLAVRDVNAGTPALPVTFDDLAFNFRPYEPFVAYGKSKTANALFAMEATRRWARDGLAANTGTPGVIMTNLQRYMPKEWSPPAGLTKIPQQGASTSVVLAVSPLLGTFLLCFITVGGPEAMPP
jgi:NAD(P)-dependent dehydrogenase (short-subunit alcohol dehydrogenase family)